MDCACFTFLVIQYRVFTSDYFKHVVRDHREQSDMASRYVNPLVLQLRPDSSMGKALNYNVRLVLLETSCTLRLHQVKSFRFCQCFRINQIWDARIRGCLH